MVTIGAEPGVGLVLEAADFGTDLVEQVSGPEEMAALYFEGIHLDQQMFALYAVKEAFGPVGGSYVE